MRLAGVEVIVAEGFEHIHRTNLVGMGVLPVEFKPGTTRLTLGLDGTETSDIEGQLLAARRADPGDQPRATVRCSSAGDLPPGHRAEVHAVQGRWRAAALCQDFLESWPQG